MGDITNKEDEKEKDNAKGLTLDQFRAEEFIYWVVYVERLGLRHRLEEYDALIVTDENDTAQLWNVDELLSEGAQIGVPFTKNNSQIILYKSLTPQILRLEEIQESKDLRQFSFYQHQLLRGIIHAVDEHSRPFLHSLFHAKQGKLPVIKKTSENAIGLMKYLVDFLTKNCIHKGEPLIPDLISFCSSTSLMSCGERYVYDLLEGQRDGKKYTYMFSRYTSENFATVLIEVLNGKLDDQKFLAGFDKQRKISAERDFMLAATVNERLEILTKTYNLNATNRTNRLEYSNASLMFLFRILQDEKIILDNISKEQLSLAISILTGVSVHTVYNDYAFARPFDYAKMVGSEDKAKINKAKNDICNAAMGAFMKFGKNML